MLCKELIMDGTLQVLMVVVAGGLVVCIFQMMKVITMLKEFIEKFPAGGAAFAGGAVPVAHAAAAPQADDAAVAIAIAAAVARSR
jgi:hypothetical protein